MMVLVSGGTFPLVTVFQTRDKPAAQSDNELSLFRDFGGFSGINIDDYS